MQHMLTKYHISHTHRHTLTETKRDRAPNVVKVSEGVLANRSWGSLNNAPGGACGRDKTTTRGLGSRVFSSAGREMMNAADKVSVYAKCMRLRSPWAGVVSVSGWAYFVDRIQCACPRMNKSRRRKPFQLIFN